MFQVMKPLQSGYIDTQLYYMLVLQLQDSDKPAVDNSLLPVLGQPEAVGARETAEKEERHQEAKADEDEVNSGGGCRRHG